MRCISFSLAISTFLLSCGTENTIPVSSTFPGARFLAMERFAFTADIDPTTLSEERRIFLFNSFDNTRDNLYTIVTQEDLDLFNQTVSDNEKVTLVNLQDYTYFFIRTPLCSDFFEYAGNTYRQRRLTILLNRFRFGSDGVCTAEVKEEYYVFRANKQALV